MEQAIDACVADNADFCENCANPLCVFPEILDELLVGSDIEKTKEAFVQYGLGLNSSTMDVLDDYPDVMTSLFDELNVGDVDDFCGKVEAGQDVAYALTNYLTYNTSPSSEVDFVVSQVDNLLASNGLTATVGETASLHLNLLITSSDYAEVNAAVATLPAWMWPLIKEIAIEAAVEIISKQFPNSPVANFIQAAQSAQQGDLLGLIAELLDIGKTYWPNLKLVSSVYDGKIAFNKATKAWNAFQKMEEFGQNVVESFFTVIKSHAGGILGKFKWKSNAVGAELFDIADPELLWDDFEALFPSATILSLNQLQPQEIAGFTLNSGQMRFVIKFGGNTHPMGYTLEFKKGSYTFKVRIM